MYYLTNTCNKKSCWIKAIKLNLDKKDIIRKMKFLDVKTDFAFKKVFGSEDSKERLISFLNAIIQFENNAHIKDLTIVDPYNIPQLKGMKDTYVDVKAVLDNGSKVIIEMQVLNHAGFEKRILYNAAKNYSMQLVKSEQYHLLNPIIALTIVDFTMFEDADKVISNFKLVEKEEFINYSDDLEMIFIELPKFIKEQHELKDIKDQWIYFIKNAGSLEYIPDNMSPLVNSAFNVSNTAGLSPEELEIQYKKKEFISIQKLALQLAQRQGEAKGKAEGKAEEKMEMAKSMLLQGISIDIVANVSGLPQEVLVKLKQGNKKH